MLDRTVACEARLYQTRHYTF